MAWTENPGAIALIISVAYPALTKLAAFLTRHQAAQRAETLKEIQSRTDGLDRLCLRLQEDNARLARRVRSLEEAQRDAERYITAVEQVLSVHRIPAPPRWPRRDSERDEEEET